MSKWRRLQREVSLVGFTPESWRCVECGVETAPGNFGRKHVEAELNKKRRPMFTVSEQSEVYTVHEHVWKAAGMEPWGGCLCIGCLETRIGRGLRPEDFPTSEPFNFSLPGTSRLLQRQGRYAPLGDWEDRT
jgi:hypothetical protein